MAVVTKYSYVKVVAISQLREEISSSAIVVALDHIDLAADALDIYMKDAISVDDKTALDAVVTAHVIDNTSLDEPSDSDGSKIIRLKAGKAGSTYYQHYIQFITSKMSSLVERDHIGNDLGHTSIAFFKYDMGALVSCAEDMAEITQVDFSPDFDYEVIGGQFRLTVTPNDDTWLWVIGVPDVPAPLGSKVMIQNCNMKFYGLSDPAIADGKVVKQMIYQVPGLPDGWGNKMRFYIRHHKAINLEMQIQIEMYKT